MMLFLAQTYLWFDRSRSSSYESEARQNSRPEASKPQKRRENCDEDDEEGDSEEVSVLILVFYYNRTSINKIGWRMSTHFSCL